MPVYPLNFHGAAKLCENENLCLACVLVTCLGFVCNVGVCGCMRDCVYVFPGAPPADGLLKQRCIR